MDADEVQRLVYRPDVGLEGWTPVAEVRTVARPPASQRDCYRFGGIPVPVPLSLTM